MTPPSDLQKILQRIGLSEKQAAVYLACLMLGPSSVQNIARKASIARATTYPILGGLISRRLVIRHMVEKRSVYIAQNPKELLRLVTFEEKALQEQKEKVESLLPTLGALSFDKERDMMLSYHEGLDGLKTIRYELVKRCDTNEEWKNIAPADQVLKTFGVNGLYCRERVAKRIRSKTLFSTGDDKLKKYLLSKSTSHFTQRRFIDPVDSEDAVGITICRNYVAFALYGNRIGGVLIDSKAISSRLTKLFDFTWNYAKQGE